MSKKEEISKVNLSDIKRTFELLDKNGDNKLSPAEFTRGAKMINKRLTKEEAKTMIAEIDVDGNGFIEYAEYEQKMKVILEKIDRERALVLHNFKKFDKDGSGSINFDELHNVLSTAGWNLSDEEIKDHFKQADLNNDGKITFAEFQKYFTTL